MAESFIQHSIAGDDSSNVASIATGTMTVSSSAFTIKPGFIPNRLVVCLFSYYKNPSCYIPNSSYLLISCYWSGSELFEFWQSYSSQTTFNGTSKNMGVPGGSVTAAASGTKISLREAVIPSNGAPIRWVAWIEK